jgi:alpha-L-rhamnosidase
MKYYLLSALLFFCISAYSQVTVADLRCNHTTNPIGIDDVKPMLSWKLASNENAISQVAYQIIVGLENNPETKVVWNSGKVTSSQSAFVSYAGKRLEYGKRYYWKVKVWDNKGRESSFSDVAFWETTLDGSNWKADWISAPAVFDFAKLNRDRYAVIRGAKADFLEPLPLLRKSFSVNERVKQARLYIAAPGFHETYINGKKLGDDVLNPSFTNYDKTVLYNVYDVTAHVKPGENAAGVMLGNGWYNSTSKEVWGFDKAPWRDDPTLRFQLEIEYTDGTKQLVLSDASWIAKQGPITFSAVRQGEYYDARLEVEKWSEAGIDEKSWTAVRKVQGPVGTLRPQLIPATKVMKTFSPVQTKELPNGDIVYDFGQNIAGFVNVTLSGEKGSRVQFLYAEKINAKGEADQSGINNLLADSLFQVDRYTLNGSGDETWSPRFVYHGFRYIQVSFKGQKPSIKSITSSATHTSFEDAGSFSCSNELINKIQNATQWSYRNNFVGFPTDCPQREKNGWTGDAQLACETGLTNFNSFTSYQKWSVDIKDEQQPNGSLPGIIPTAGWGYYWGNGPAWDIACVVTPWTSYLYTGDTRALSDNYDVIKKYVDYMNSRSPELITEFGLGDWIPVKTETPVGITSTGYFYYGASTLAKIAGILGNNADEKKYGMLASLIKAAFNKKFFNEKAMTYGNGSQTALSCALFHGLVPDKYRQKIYQKLVEAVHAKDDHIDVGVLGARYIQHALTDQGNAELAYKLVAAKTYPGWGYWIENGATTLWEDWKGEASLDHIMFGDVSSWFYKALGGIRPDEKDPGYKHFFIKPEFVSDLTWVKSSYESSYGTIISNWKREGKTITHDVTVPANSQASYVVAVKNRSGVRVNGKSLAEGAFETGTSDGKLFIKLPSGTYSVQLAL